MEWHVMPIWENRLEFNPYNLWQIWSKYFWGYFAIKKRRNMRIRRKCRIYIVDRRQGTHPAWSVSDLVAWPTNLTLLPKMFCPSNHKNPKNQSIMKKDKDEDSNILVVRKCIHKHIDPKWLFLKQFVAMSLCVVQYVWFLRGETFSEAMAMNCLHRSTWTHFNIWPADSLSNKLCKLSSFLTFIWLEMILNTLSSIGWSVGGHRALPSGSI